MTLLHHLRAAAADLKSAVRLAADWRVREAVAGAGTALNCAIHLQEKIESGELKIKEEAPPTKKCHEVREYARPHPGPLPPGEGES